MKKSEHRAMTTNPRPLPDADAIRERINAIEGGSTAVEVLTHGQSRRKETSRVCALVRSTESRRVYLVVHEGDRAAGWQPPCEIIGFDGLRAKLRTRQRTAGRKRKTA